MARKNQSTKQGEDSTQDGLPGEQSAPWNTGGGKEDNSASEETEQGASSEQSSEESDQSAGEPDPGGDETQTGEDTEAENAEQSVKSDNEPLGRPVDDQEAVLAHARHVWKKEHEQKAQDDATEAEIRQRVRKEQRKKRAAMQ